MLFKHLCQILLLISVCVASATHVKSNDTDDIKIKSETKDVAFGLFDNCGCGDHGWCPSNKWSSKKCDCYYGYYEKDGKCVVCDCGHGTCNNNEYSSRKCDCDEGYVERGGICADCNCGENVRTCDYDYNDVKSCYCKRGYEEYNGTCQACYCDNADCKFEPSGEKVCTCNSGYGMKNGKCTDCDCNPGKSCVFDNNAKECICPPRYANDKGSCKVCDCGLDKADCKLVYGFKKCICPKGYEMKKQFAEDSTCVDIDECLDPEACPDSTDCTNTPGSYECACRNGYVEFNYYRHDKNKVDGCEDCGCGADEAICTRVDDLTKCVCPVGYEETTKTDTNSTTCKEINHCLVSVRCPYNTKCVSNPRGYTCVCKDGYRKVKGGYENDYIECEDIDECASEVSPCADPNTDCQNTEGSFYCNCKQGYSVIYYYGSDSHSSHFCEQTYRPWKDAYIAVAVISSLLCVILLIAICLIRLNKSVVGNG